MDCDDSNVSLSICLSFKCFHLLYLQSLRYGCDDSNFSMSVSAFQMVQTSPYQSHPEKAGSSRTFETWRNWLSAMTVLRYTMHLMSGWTVLITCEIATHDDGTNDDEWCVTVCVCVFVCVCVCGVNA